MKKNSKEAIVQAAISLFQTKGYSGTSIRDIGKKAKVNSASISYHFHNKQGLLEYCFTSFFEQYLAIIEEAYMQLQDGAVNCLKQISREILRYLSKNSSLASFVLREMSMESQIAREIMATYYAKEKFFLQQVFEAGIEQNEFKLKSISYAVIQLKGLWLMPFINASYLREVFYMFPNEPFFAEKYTEEICQWIDKALCRKDIAV
ncbi:forespore capture DNA-binding protein RefZ [Bacillota bacterium Lsc_1132]